MPNKIIKGLAIAAGTGLAIGLGNSRNHPAADNRAAGGASETDLPDHRLTGFESRLSALEALRADTAAAAAGIEGRFDGQGREIAALRVRMAETRDAVGAVERRFDEVAKALPDLVESVMTAQVGALRASLAAGIQESVDATLESFEKTIDSKVTLRVATLEKALVDQSGIITALSQRALESDANLQRLISAVEKLCERAEGRPAAPFEKHLDDAIKRPPAAAPGFRPAIVKEEDELRPRHRLTRL